MLITLVVTRAKVHCFGVLGVKCLQLSLKPDIVGRLFVERELQVMQTAIKQIIRMDSKTADTRTVQSCP